MVLPATVFALSTMVLVQPLLPRQASAQAALTSASASASSSELRRMPGGRSTVMGGDIRDVDPVRDQFILKVFGGQSVRVLFDERTQVFRDGARVPLLSLLLEDHASVETALDGTKIFALRIHMLSQLPEGDCRGLVLSYNPRTGDLTLNAALSQEPIRLHVPAGTSMVRVGQEASSAPRDRPFDFASGSLIDVKFKGDASGHGVATHVDILGVPGSAFIFSGNLSFLDVHSGRLVIVDPRDKQSYEVAFDPSGFPVSRELHEGSIVKVTTTFDGRQYVAKDIAIK